MCVIAYKAKDVRFPDEERVRDMWDANRDGAGVMWRDPGTDRIRFVKGFMRLGDLEKWISGNRAWLEEVECALHFRITTHGGTSEGNCHPFVVGGGDSHLLSGEADHVLMHNGILGIAPRSKDISDTAELAIRLGAFSDPMAAMDAFSEQFCGNRIVIFGPGKTGFYGDAFKKSADGDGILYSNLTWEYRFAASPSSASRYDWDGRIGAVYDRTLRKWVNPLDSSVVPIDDVDPDYLSQDDYDEYESQMYQRGYELAFSRGVVKDDDEYDELEEEAADNGMTVTEYLAFCGHVN